MPGNPVYHTPFCPLGNPQMSKWGSFTTHHVVIVLVVFTPLKRVFLPSYSEGKGQKRIFKPIFWVETAYKTHFLMQKP